MDKMRKEIGNNIVINGREFTIKKVGNDKEDLLLWLTEKKKDVIAKNDKKICVIIGHGGSDVGAVSQDKSMSELKYNTEIAEKLAEQLKKSGYDVFIHNRGYARMENVSYINSQNPNLIVSLHCNSASNTEATGTEVIHFPDSKNGKKLAEILSKNISNSLLLRNRGAKEPFHGRGNGLLRSTNAPCVIIEPFFISNNEDLRKGIEYKDSYIQAIVKSINEYFS